MRITQASVLITPPIDRNAIRGETSNGSRWTHLPHGSGHPPLQSATPGGGEPKPSLPRRMQKVESPRRDSPPETCLFSETASLGHRRGG